MFQLLLTAMSLAVMQCACVSCLKLATTLLLGIWAIALQDFAGVCTALMLHVCHSFKALSIFTADCFLPAILV